MADGLDRMFGSWCSVTHCQTCPEIKHIVLIVALGKGPSLGLDGTGTPYRKRVAAGSRSESPGRHLTRQQGLISRAWGLWLFWKRYHPKGSRMAALVKKAPDVACTVDE